MDEFINEDTIVKDDVYKNFKESLTCPLCLHILMDPVMCSNCQIAFCKKCIEDFSKKNDKCPNYCANPNYKNSIGKNEILSELKVKCENCNSIISYNNAKDHQKFCNKKKDNNNINKNNIIENKKEKNMQRLTLDEVSKYKQKGKSVTLITGKKK